MSVQRGWVLPVPTQRRRMATVGSCWSFIRNGSRVGDDEEELTIFTLMTADSVITEKALNEIDAYLENPEKLELNQDAVQIQDTPFRLLQWGI